MKVLKVFQTSGTRQGSIFGIISETSELICNKDILKIKYLDKDHYFEVYEVSTSDNIFYFKAQEVGYYNLFSKMFFLDLRKILNQEIEIVKDNEILEQLQKERHYC